MARSSESTSRATARRGERLVVLLIDNDADFRNGLAENLRDDGHQVREYETPAAIPTLDDMNDVHAVVVADYNCRHEGLVFADRFHAAYPTVPIVLVTAYWSESVEAEAAQRDFLCVRSKPLDYDELHDHLQTGHRARSAAG